MADNVAITAGTGTTMATDDIAGTHYPRVKISQGADGSATDVSSAAPLNVTLANGTVPSHAVTNAGTFAVQATVAAGATNIAKAEDAAHSSGDTGVYVLAVRTDTAAASSGTTGDYESLHTDDLGNLRVHIDDRQLDGSEYEWFDASATTTLGATGATGDYLRELLLTPSTVSPGAVQVKDGSGTARTVFAGGTNSCSNLVPFTVSFGATSTSGAWQVITNAGITGHAFGNFT